MLPTPTAGRPHGGCRAAADAVDGAAHRVVDRLGDRARSRRRGWCGAPRLPAASVDAVDRAAGSRRALAGRGGGACRASWPPPVVPPGRCRRRAGACQSVWPPPAGLARRRRRAAAGPAPAGAARSAAGAPAAASAGPRRRPLRGRRRAPRPRWPPPPAPGRAGSRWPALEPWPPKGSPLNATKAPTARKAATAPAMSMTATARSREVGASLGALGDGCAVAHSDPSVSRAATRAALAVQLVIGIARVEPLAILDRRVVPMASRPSGQSPGR